MSHGQTKTNWQGELLANGLRLSVLFGLIIYPLSLYVTYTKGVHWLGASYTLGFACLVVLHFWKGLGHRLRSVGFGAIFYGLAIALLINASFIGQVYLLGYSILMALFLGRRVGLATAALNLVTLLMAGWLNTDAGVVVISDFEGTPFAWGVISLGEVVRVLEESLRSEREARHQATVERETAFAMSAELSKTVEALSESEARLKEFSENVREIFYVQDAHTGDMLYWNSMYAELWGESLESLKLAPQSYRNRVLPEDIRSPVELPTI